MRYPLFNQVRLKADTFTPNANVFQDRGHCYQGGALN